MLTRKQSLRGDVALADFGPDDNLNDNADIEWVNKVWVRRVLRGCALLSLISVSQSGTRLRAVRVDLFTLKKYVTNIRLSCCLMITWF